MKIKLRSLYVCVKNMDRAISFYEKLLGQSVTERDPIYSVFVIGEFRYGLFAFEKMGEPHRYGNSCLPSFEVDDIQRLNSRLREMGCEIPFPLTKIGSNWVLECMDSEGNQLEVTAPL